MPRGEARAHRTDLTGAEVETLLLYCEGLPIETIARRLFRDPTSIYARLYRICDAWGVASPLGLVKAAAERRLVQVGSLPAFEAGGQCPCCREVLPGGPMQVLAFFWEGRGVRETAAWLGMSETWVKTQYPWLRERLGCERGGAHAFVAGALRTGLLEAWRKGVGRELGLAVAGAVADGGWDVDRPHLGWAEIRDAGRVPRASGAILADAAA